jgi:hypothetical protein
MSSPTSGRFPLHDDSDRYQGYSPEDSFTSPYSQDSRVLHRMGSEPDVKGVALRSRVSPPTPLPVIQSTPTPSIKGPQSRPQSVYTIDKDLPPIPPEPGAVNGRRTHPAAEPFPAYDTLPNKRSTVVSPQEFEPPSRLFATEPRRQSFGGMESRPEFSGLEVPTNEQPYGDFGMARRSLNRLDDALEYSEMNNNANGRASSPPEAQTVRHKPPTKRRSRFGLSSLLGRKSYHEKGHSPNPSESRPQIEAVGFIAHPFETDPSQSRMSSGSRTGNGQAVEQDRNFVAYRYPSASEQLNLPVS